MTNITGKCHCGKNTFTLQSEPEFQFVCYCKGCRTLNSGGHLCGVMLDDTNFTAAEDTQTYVYQGGSGDEIVLHFCGMCATHLYAYPKHFEGKVVVRANTLSDEHFKPQQTLFAESAFSWDALTKVTI